MNSAQSGTIELHVISSVVSAKFYTDYARLLKVGVPPLGGHASKVGSMAA